MTEKKPTTVEPQTAQVYRDGRNNDAHQILYIDEQIVLLRCSGTRRDGEYPHRIERRTHFDKQVEEGHFTYQPDSDVDLMDFDQIDWSEVPYVGEKTAANLHEAGYSTIIDIQNAEEGELTDVDGVGSTGAENLREFAQ